MDASAHIKRDVSTMIVARSGAFRVDPHERVRIWPSHPYITIRQARVNVRSDADPQTREGAVFRVYIGSVQKPHSPCKDDPPNKSTTTKALLGYAADIQTASSRSPAALGKARPHFVNL